MRSSLFGFSFAGLALAALGVACSSPTDDVWGSGGSGPVANSGGAGPGAGGASAAGGSGGAPGGLGTGGAGGDVADPGSGGNENPQLGSGGTAGNEGSGGAPPVVIERPPLVTSAQGNACAPTLEGCSYWRVDGQVTESTANADVTVSDTARQVFIGFGGSFNEEGWQNLLQLAGDLQEKALALLFDAADGAHFVLGRIPIGASDYAVAPRYSLQESASAPVSIERDRELLIPYIKAAQAVSSNIHFWGSPWSPPPWMKSNNAYDGGNLTDSEAVLEALANYFVSFIQQYGDEGIKVEAIHPQNEPGFSQNYPSCGWPGDLMTRFIGDYLGPKFEDLDIDADIFIGTMSNSSSDGTLLKNVAGNAKAMGYVKGYGLQWGMLSVYGSLGLDPKLQIWQTEHKCGNYPFGGQTLPSGIPGSIGSHRVPAPNDHAYAEESWGLIRDWIKAGVTSYSAWNMVLDTNGVGEIDTTRTWAQNALLTVDLGSKKLNLTPTYFVFRHVAQYVDPGATRLDTSGGDALAFKNLDGSVTTVMYNSGSEKTVTVAVLGKKLSFTLPGRGWATLNVKP